MLGLLFLILISCSVFCCIQLGNPPASYNTWIKQSIKLPPNCKPINIRINTGQNGPNTLLCSNGDFYTLKGNILNGWLGFARGISC